MTAQENPVRSRFIIYIRMLYHRQATDVLHRQYHPQGKDTGLLFKGSKALSLFCNQCYRAAAETVTLLCGEGHTIFLLDRNLLFPDQYSTKLKTMVRHA